MDENEFFSCHIKDEGDVHVVYVEGELDIVSSPPLKAVLRVDRSPVVVDLSNLTFMDASGLRALLEAKREAVANGRTLTLERASGIVRRVFDITGFSAELDA
jgi:anti-sigma B factor antagonist